MSHEPDSWHGIAGMVQQVMLLLASVWARSQANPHTHTELRAHQQQHATDAGRTGGTHDTKMRSSWGVWRFMALKLCAILPCDTITPLGSPTTHTGRWQIQVIIAGGREEHSGLRLCYWQGRESDHAEEACSNQSLHLPTGGLGND